MSKMNDFCVALRNAANALEDLAYYTDDESVSEYLYEMIPGYADIECEDSLTKALAIVEALNR